MFTAVERYSCWHQGDTVGLFFISGTQYDVRVQSSMCGTSTMVFAAVLWVYGFPCDLETERRVCLTIGLVGSSFKESCSILSLVK